MLLVYPPNMHQPAKAHYRLPVMPIICFLCTVSQFHNLLPLCCTCCGYLRELTFINYGIDRVAFCFFFLLKHTWIEHLLCATQYRKHANIWASKVYVQHGLQRRGNWVGGGGGFLESMAWWQRASLWGVLSPGWHQRSRLERPGKTVLCNEKSISFKSDRQDSHQGEGYRWGQTEGGSRKLAGMRARTSPSDKDTEEERSFICYHLTL